MKKINLKQHLFIITHRNESGFTLIELIISLSLMSFFLLITLPIWSNFNYQTQAEYFSVHQFFHIVTDEVQQNKAIIGSQHELIVKKIDGNQIALSKYYDTIRRRVNQTGHEILLRDVKTYEVIHNQHYLIVKLQMKSGNHYEKIITKFNE